MEVSIKERHNEQGVLEFLGVGFDATSEYDYLVKVLSKLGLQPEHQFDGIWWKNARYSLSSGVQFEMVFDEDVGIYFFTKGQTTDGNEELRQLLAGMVARINQALARRDSQTS